MPQRCGDPRPLARRAGRPAGSAPCGEARHAGKLSNVLEGCEIKQPIDVRRVEQQKVGEDLAADAALAGYERAHQREVVNNDKEQPDPHRQTGRGAALLDEDADEIGKRQEREPEQDGAHDEAGESSPACGIAAPAQAAARPAAPYPTMAANARIAMWPRNLPKIISQRETG